MSAPNPRCCHTCWELAGANPFGRIMHLCPICGNKRCPKATDHTLACTGSNEPGQVGSLFGPRRYVSPIPLAFVFDYRNRVEGQPVERFLHQWPTGFCDPKGCRECYRERHWVLGQTHG